MDGQTFTQCFGAGYPAGFPEKLTPSWEAELAAPPWWGSALTRTLVCCRGQVGQSFLLAAMGLRA